MKILRFFAIAMLALLPAAPLLAQAAPPTQPAISNLRTELVGRNSFTIAWDTNIGTDAYVHATGNLANLPQVPWGRVHDYNQTQVSHSHTYFGLEPNTTSYFEVRSSVPGGGSAIQSGTVTTNGPVITPPDGPAQGGHVDLLPTAVRWVTGERTGLLVILTNSGSEPFQGSFVVSLFDLDGQSYVDYYTFTGTLVAGHSYNAIVNTLYGGRAHYPNLRVTVDSANRIPEDNEANNSVEYHYTEPTVDLQPGVPHWVNGQGLRMAIRNGGTSPLAGPFTVSLSDTETNSVVEYYPFPSNVTIQPGSSFDALLSPIYGAPGSNHQLTILLDSSNIIPETTERNNSVTYRYQVEEDLPVLPMLPVEPRTQVTPDSSEKPLTPRERELMERIKKLQIRISELERSLIERERNLVTKVDPKLTERVKGDILLQVEGHGEAWYVDKETGKKFYLENGEAAYNALRVFGLGINNSDLQKIPVADSGKAAAPKDLLQRVDGRILLQVEGHGEAWYVADGQRYYLKDGPAAYELLRQKGLGITNADLRKIQVGSFE